MGNVADSHGARNRSGERFEVRDLAGLVVAVFLAHHDANGVPEPAQDDEAQVEGEERGPGDEPEHDQRKLDAAHWDRVEDHA